MSAARVIWIEEAKRKQKNNERVFRIQKGSDL